MTSHLRDRTDRGARGLKPDDPRSRYNMGPPVLRDLGETGLACERGVLRALIAHAEAVPAGPTEEQAETEGPVSGDVRSQVAGSSTIAWKGRPGGQLYLFRHHKPSRFEAQRGGGVAGPDGQPTMAAAMRMDIPRLSPAA